MSDAGSGRELGGVRAGAADRPCAAVDPDSARHRLSIRHVAVTLAI
jgi:hypothetical protein